MTKAEKAVELKQNGYNCCQAVIAAYADDIGLTDEVVRKVGAGFGSGMGNMEGNCGALCGAQIVLGMKEYSGKPIGSKAKALHGEFVKRAGAAICREIKGRDTGKALCSCDDCVKHAAAILEEM